MLLPQTQIQDSRQERNKTNQEETTFLLLPKMKYGTIVAFVTLLFLLLGVLAQVYILKPDAEQKTRDTLNVWFGQFGILFTFLLTLVFITVLIYIRPFIAEVRSVTERLAKAVEQVGAAADVIQKVTQNIQGKGSGIGSILTKGIAAIGNAVAQAGPP
jgi:hypothetical protein